MKQNIFGLYKNLKYIQYCEEICGVCEAQLGQMLITVDLKEKKIIRKTLLV